MALCENCREPLPVASLPREFFDSNAHTISVPAHQRHIQPMGWKILEALWRRRGRYVHYEALYQVLYGDSLDPPPSNALTVHVCYLRRNLLGTGWSIATSHGQGIKLLAPGELP